MLQSYIHIYCYCMDAIFFLGKNVRLSVHFSILYIVHILNQVEHYLIHI